MVIRCFTGRQFQGKRRVAPLLLGILFVFGLASCGSHSKSSPAQISSGLPAIGVAYVGPATMNLRQDLAAKSAGVMEVKHGDRLDIIETRRRLVRVRTEGGVEGWVDANLLLTSQQMDELQRLAEESKKLPSQGSATVFDQLNLHTEPNRTSPSFAQIREGGGLEVLAHRMTPRIAARPKTLVAAKPAPAPKASRKDAKKAAALLLPPPAAPAPPRDWEQLSRPRAADLPDYVAPASPPPAPLEDWDLVRTKDGKVGWVLARMLYMAIPDDVAQYAEGKRITAYLSIGDVQDGEILKHNWLWTTASNGVTAGEFDGMRVFVWSKSRHRYETAYIERNVTGFYPVQLAEIPGDKEQGFSLLAQDKDGVIYKRIYGFSGYHVRLISKAPVPKPEPPTGATGLLTADASSPARPASWWQKWGTWPSRLFNRP